MLFIGLKYFIHILAVLLNFIVIFQNSSMSSVQYERGVALLYVFCAEPLNFRNKDNQLHGIPFKGSNVTFLIYLYADNLTSILADRMSITSCFDQLNTYCKATEAKINTEESEVLVINYTGVSIVQLHLPFIVKTNGMEFLGIIIIGEGYNHTYTQQLEEENC